MKNKFITVYRGELSVDIKEADFCHWKEAGWGTEKPKKTATSKRKVEEVLSDVDTTAKK